MKHALLNATAFLPFILYPECHQAQAPIPICDGALCWDAVHVLLAGIVQM